MTTLKKYTINLYIALLFFAITSAMGADLKPMGAELKPWNASDVLQLSDELFSAARRLHIECRNSPPNYLDQENSSGHLAFRYHVRHLVSVTNDLSRALEDGMSREETQAIYIASVDIVADLKPYSDNNPTGAWPAVSNAVTRVEGVLAQLGAYYSPQ